MVASLDFGYGIDDDALFVDDVGGAQRAFGDLAVHLLLAPGLIGFEYGEVRVGDEPERQVIFCYEALVRGSG